MVVDELPLACASLWIYGKGKSGSLDAIEKIQGERRKHGALENLADYLRVTTIYNRLAYSLDRATALFSMQ